MILTGLLFVGVIVLVRILDDGVHPIQAAFIRYIFGLILLAPLIKKFSFFALSRKKIKFHLIRGIVHSSAVMLWFFAMTRLSIAEVTALGFLTPIFVFLGALIFLREKFYTKRICAIFISLIGAIIILRPGFRIIDVGAIAQLIAAPLFAWSFLMAKSATRTDSSVFIVVMLSFFCTVSLFFPALLVWTAPSVEEWILLILTAFLATSGHYCMTRALKETDVSLLQPFVFVRLIWSTLAGIYFFNETPDLWIWVGSAIIVISASWAAQHESKIKESI